MWSLEVIGQVKRKWSKLVRVVKNYGQAQEAQRKVHQKIDKENISIFVFNNLKNLNYAYGNL